MVNVGHQGSELIGELRTSLFVMQRYNIEEKEEQVSLLVHRHTIRGLNTSGERSIEVFVICTTILFYAMESSGILNVEDPIQLFALHTIFIPRVNNSLREFSEAFNNHRVSTEGNWTPYQIWMNGMMHANNPLAHGDVDGEPDDIQLYGYDPEGPSPSEEYNNVVVEAMSLDNRHSIESYVLDVVDPLTQSTQVRIDLYIQALDLVRDRME